MPDKLNKKPRPENKPNDLWGKLLDDLQWHWRVVRTSIEKIPQLRYLLAFLAITSGVAIVQASRMDIKSAVLSAIMVLVVMVMIFVFAALAGSGSRNKDVKLAARCMLWVAVACFAFSAVLLFWSAFFCPNSYAYLMQAPTSMVFASPPPSQESLIDTKPLLNIARYGGKQLEDTNISSYNTYEEFMVKANKGFFEKFKVATIEAKNFAKKRDWTVVTAPAGLGKSTIISLLKNKSQSAFFVMDLSELKDAAHRCQPQIRIREVEDLHSVEPGSWGPKSNLLGFGGAGDSLLLQSAPSLIELSKCFGFDLMKEKSAILIIDSLDEIAPDSALSLLKNIATEIKLGNGLPDYFHVFAFGRPEGFVPYYRDSHPIKKPIIFELTPPMYRTKADLKVVAEFSRKYNNRRPEDLDALVGLAAEHPFIFESIHLLSMVSDLIKNSAERFRAERSSENVIKELLLDQMLERNSRSHNRPTHKDLNYMHILEEIASKYTNVDKNGFFTVLNNDEVVLYKDEGRSGVPLRYNVALTLSRSGVAYLNPTDWGTSQFRFLPSWLHEYLVSSRNTRVKRQNGKLMQNYNYSKASVFCK